MAESSAPPRHSTGSTDVSNDAELNLISARFHPLRALGSNFVHLPVSNAVARDNIHSCKDLLPPYDPNYKPPRETKANKTDSNKSKGSRFARKKLFKNTIERFSVRFKEPMPISCVASAFYRDMTLTDKRKAMDDYSIFGPMSVLKNIFNE
ncbi:hypothetical protein AAMO2058_001101400 [Amorphochlora amoebiformis]